MDLSDPIQLKDCVEVIQYIHKDSVNNKGLNLLWNKTCALDPLNVAGLLFAPPVTNFIKRTLKKKFKSKFSDDEIQASINRIIHEPIALENIKPTKITKSKKKVIVKEEMIEPTLTVLETIPQSNYTDQSIQITN